MLRHTGERSFSGPRFVNPVTKNSCPIESLRSTLSSTLEKKHFQDPDLWIMWQKVHVKCNLKEAHSFPYWRKANFRTRICESCDKKFMSSAILKNHIVFHTGEKPFSGPEFVNPVKKVHVNWNLWEAHSLPHWRKAIFRTRICESCDKKFMPRGILKKHIVFHSGEKPSSCANCT